MDNTELAKEIAKEIFDAGKELYGINPMRPYRMEYKIGKHGCERGAGGLCEDAMERLILRVLQRAKPKNSR